MIEISLDTPHFFYRDVFHTDTDPAIIYLPETEHEEDDTIILKHNATRKETRVTKVINWIMKGLTWENTLHAIIKVTNDSTGTKFDRLLCNDYELALSLSDYFYGEEEE